MIFIPAAAGLTFRGWRRGGMRLGLLLVPLICMGLSVRWLGPLLFRLNVHHLLGLLGTGLTAAILGLVVGEVVYFLLRKRLPVGEERNQTDRYFGVAVGLLLSLLLAWTGSTIMQIRAAERYLATGDLQTGAKRSAFAGAVQRGLVSWIPGVGGFTRDIDLLIEFTTASQEARRQALRKLELDRLSELPQLQAVADDDRTVRDIEAAQRGNIAAILRLQHNPLIIDLVETPQMRRALDRVTLRQLTEEVRKAEAAGGQEG
ncbi:MAG TPA: hypothetical protein ENJ06_05960 [Phycisphaeraceae bacterium]|nr:hypothetical protein [Phycisphaeraceae bacterium]